MFETFLIRIIQIVGIIIAGVIILKALGMVCPC